MGELEGWKSCPRCGTELAGDLARLSCGACGFVVYASSKPTACALCVDDGRVLLARRAHPPFKGFWDIPGGFLDEGEDPLDGLRRELKEETGLDVEPDRFLGVWIDRYDGDSTGQLGSSAARPRRPTTSPSSAGSAATSCPGRASSPSRTSRSC
jgi:hypothetical protein